MRSLQRLRVQGVSPVSESLLLGFCSKLHEWGILKSLVRIGEFRDFIVAGENGIFQFHKRIEN